MNFIGILVLVLVSTLVLVAFILAMVRLMGKWFGRLSGWNALEQRFPGAADMPEGAVTGPVRIGSVYIVLAISTMHGYRQPGYHHVDDS